MNRLDGEVRPINRSTRDMKGRLLLGATLAVFTLQIGPALGQEVLPFPDPPMGGKVGPTMQESVHKWRQTPRRLPEHAPNILIVMFDDAGFGQPDTFGGEIHTPTLSRLAEEGIAYNRFHTTAMSSPTRGALLTGRNHHRVGAGQIAELGGKVVMDEQANTATFSLQGVINKDDMLRNRVKLPLVVELVHPAQSVAFLVNVSVQDVAVEKNIIDKSVDSSKQVIDDTVGFYKGLFSKKEDDSQLETLEKNEQQSIKMESKIVFALQRIATSNACYEMNDNTITRFSSCQMN